MFTWHSFMQWRRAVQAKKSQEYGRCDEGAKDVLLFLHVLKWFTSKCRKLGIIDVSGNARRGKFTAWTQQCSELVLKYPNFVYTWDTKLMEMEVIFGNSEFAKCLVNPVQVWCPFKRCCSGNNPSGNLFVCMCVLMTWPQRSKRWDHFVKYVIFSDT